MVLTLVVLVAAIAALWPIIRRLSTAVQVLGLGYPLFGVAASFGYRPDEAALSGIFAVPAAYFQTLDHTLVVRSFALVGGCILAGGAIVRSFAIERDAAPRSAWTAAHAAASVRAAAPPAAAPPVADSAAATPGTLATPGAGKAPLSIVLALPGSALYLSFLILLIRVVGVGPGYVLRSPTYLAFSGPAAFVHISTAATPIAIVIAANVFFARDHSRTVRLLAAVNVVAIEAVLFGQGTRLFSVCFVLIFAGGWLAGQWSPRRTIAMLTGAIVLTIVTLGVPLHLRGQDRHGLLPSLQYLIADPGSFFSGDANPWNNLLLGAPLSMFVGRSVPPIGAHALWTSVNPAPGSTTDWPTISPTLRLNQFEPYSAVGELLNHGLLTTVVYALVIGAIFQLLTTVGRRAAGQYSTLIQAAVIGTAGLFLIRSTQYNLRTVSRLVYYLIVGVAVGFVLSRALYRSRRVQQYFTATEAVSPEPESAQADPAALPAGALRRSVGPARPQLARR